MGSGPPGWSGNGWTHRYPDRPPVYDGAVPIGGDDGGGAGSDLGYAGVLGHENLLAALRTLGAFRRNCLVCSKQLFYFYMKKKNIQFFKELKNAPKGAFFFNLS